MSDRYVAFESFKWGLDARKSELTTQPGALLQLDNAHINNGGEIEQRKSFVKDPVPYPLTTFGLQDTDSGLVTFGSRPPTTPTESRSRAANVATVVTSFAINLQLQPGDSVVVTGLGGVGYNGTVVVLTATSTQFTYASIGPNEAITIDAGGLITFVMPLPTGVTYQQLAHPTGFRCSSPGVFVTCDMTQVTYSCNFRGKAFVIARYEDGNSFLYYDGSLVLSSRNGLVLCRSTGAQNPHSLAIDLAVQISQFTDWIALPDVDETGAAFDGSTIIMTPVGTHIAIVPSATTLNGILGVELIDQNNPGVAGVAAQVTFTLNAGTNGTVAVLAPMKIDGTDVQPLTPTATVAFTISLAATATAIVNAINSLTSAHGYSASTSGATITVTAPITFGAITYNLTVTTTGDITTTIAGGPVSVGSFALNLSPNGISFTIHTTFHTIPVRTVKASTVNKVGIPNFLWEECNSDGSSPPTTPSTIRMTISGVNGGTTATSASFYEPPLQVGQTVHGYFKCTATSAGATPNTSIIVFSVTIKLVSP